MSVSSNITAEIYDQYFLPKDILRPRDNGGGTRSSRS